MLAQKPIMGFNTWNTFGANINEQLIFEIADTMVSEGYLDAGYDYLIIDDCWSKKDRENGLIVPDPKLFPHGMKYVADYVHSKGLKFGMYTCAGFKTCAGYPGSYGHEYEDAKQFAEWGVDYLKYDFCFFPENADTKNAYLTMSMALRCSGRDIVFAACNWGKENPSQWMRSIGAHTYRSTGDIFDVPKSYIDIFTSQLNNVENNAPGCFNDMDMLICGMNGKGNVGLGGCSHTQYTQHFAMWAFMGSPLIIGSDIRNIDDDTKKLLLNKQLIAINQDEECRPPFIATNYSTLRVLAKIVDKNKIALGFFNVDTDAEKDAVAFVSLDDLGLHSESGVSLKLYDVINDCPLGNVEGKDYSKPVSDGIHLGRIKGGEARVILCEIVNG
ncbi:MAG: glycoside hydrolase family 27 protein [Clostridiales bacterium]|nr:glycoside hydrolase family 27 protein [Clostridiales bacterium]